MRPGKTSLLAMSLLAALAMADDQATATRAQLSLDDLRTFTDVFQQVKNNFVEETDDQELLNAAIRGMLSELDPHSSFLEADEFRKLDDNSHGRYGGIGVEVAIRNRRVKVTFVIEGGAADHAGVVAGDIITAIDHVDLRERDLQKAIDSLRGTPGTSVEVTFQHRNGEISTHRLIRGFVHVASVFSRLVDRDYAYFQITHFTRKSADELAEQVEFVRSRRVEPLKGIVLDIRGNPGGVLQPAVTIADGFLDEGLIVSTRGRAANQLRYTAKPGQWFAGVPMVVLVDRSTASASEVLAGALQDHGRALVAGEKTFGKGSVQSVLNLRNGAGLRLTTSRYYTPSGHSIQAQGIQPDVQVEPMQAIVDDDGHKRERDLDRHLPGEPGNGPAMAHSEVSAADDFMMYQALILLKGAGILSGGAGQGPVARPVDP